MLYNSYCCCVVARLTSSAKYARCHSSIDCNMQSRRVAKCGAAGLRTHTIPHQHRRRYVCTRYALRVVHDIIAHEPTIFSLVFSTYCFPSPLLSAYDGVAYQVYTQCACYVRVSMDTSRSALAFCAVKSGADQFDEEKMKIASGRFCVVI